MPMNVAVPVFAAVALYPSVAVTSTLTSRVSVNARSWNAVPRAKVRVVPLMLAAPSVGAPETVYVDKKYYAVTRPAISSAGRVS
jgi:hypothetical protein